MDPVCLLPSLDLDSIVRYLPRRDASAFAWLCFTWLTWASLAHFHMCSVVWTAGRSPLRRSVHLSALLPAAAPGGQPPGTPARRSKTSTNTNHQAHHLGRMGILRGPGRVSCECWGEGESKVREYEGELVPDSGSGPRVRARGRLSSAFDSFPGQPGRDHLCDSRRATGCWLDGLFYVMRWGAEGHVVLYCTIRRRVCCPGREALRSAIPRRPSRYGTGQVLVLFSSTGCDPTHPLRYNGRQVAACTYSTLTVLARWTWSAICDLQSTSSFSLIVRLGR